MFSSESTMLPLFLRGGWGGQHTQSCSSSSFKECHFSYSSESEWRSQGRRWICRPSFLRDSLRLERPDANGPGLLRAGPSVDTPHHTVPVSPQCPQEIILLTLPVFQGAAVSSEHFSQSLPSGNVVELRGSLPLLGASKAARAAVPCRSSTSGHRASSFKYTRGQSWETGSLNRLFGSVETTAKCVCGSCTLLNKAIAALCCHLSTGSLPCWWVPSRLW